MPPTLSCPHCDALISPTASFCDQCGHTLPTIRNTIRLNMPQSPKRLSLNQQLTLVNIICTITMITLTAYHWLAKPIAVPMAAPISAIASPAVLIAPEASPAPSIPSTGACNDINMYPKYYRKYEADSNAELLEIPSPKLTPDAIAHKENAIGKMRLELILAPCGVMDQVVFRGHIGYGLAVMTQKAAKQIKFRPALVNGQPVPQEVTIDYIFYECDIATICVATREVVE